MLKALFIGVFVAVIALTVKAEKANEKLVVLEVKGVEKKDNSLKNLKIPKLNLRDLKQGKGLSVLKELEINDFEKLTDKEKRTVLKKMKKEAMKLKRLRLIQKLKRKFVHKRKFKLKRQEKKEKKAFKKMLMKRRNMLKRMLAKKAHKREHKKRNKKHHKRGKNHDKREKTREKKKQ